MRARQCVEDGDSCPAVACITWPLPLPLPCLPACPACCLHLHLRLHRARIPSPIHRACVKAATSAVSVTWGSQSARISYKELGSGHAKTPPHLPTAHDSESTSPIHPHHTRNPPHHSRASFHPDRPPGRSPTPFGEFSATLHVFATAASSSDYSSKPNPPHSPHHLYQYAASDSAEAPTPHSVATCSI